MKSGIESPGWKWKLDIHLLKLMCMHCLGHAGVGGNNGADTIELYCQVSVQLHEECFVVPGTLITHSLQS